MKKLMFVAALAAVSGLYASNCTPPDVPYVEGPCAQVYQVKMSVKTTKGLAGSTFGGATQCLPGETSCFVARLTDTTKFEGYLYDCACGCNLLKDGLSIVMWDSVRKTQLDSPAFTFNFMNVMGKKQADAETEWTFAGTAKYDDERQEAYDLRGAGFGKYDAKKALFTTFSGNFAGTGDQSYDLKTPVSKAACACDPSQVFECTDLSTAVTANTVAFGTWTIKYNAAASKKLAKTQSIAASVKIPAYVVVE